jgi:hypothetical protein
MNLQTLFICLFVRATAAVAEDCPELFRGAKEVIKKGGLSTHEKTKCSSSALKLSCNCWVFARLLLLLLLLLKSVLVCERAHEVIKDVSRL